MYYDATRARIELFGGVDNSATGLGDTWAYDPVGKTWTEVTASSAVPPRAGHTLSFDATTGHGLLEGGVLYSQTGRHTPELDDIWEFDPLASSWSERTVSAAPAQYKPGVAYDTARKALVLRGSGARPAMWELASSRWTQQGLYAGVLNSNFGQAFQFNDASNSDTPGYELGSLNPLVYDSARGRTMLFRAGTYGNASTPASPPDDLWEWDGTQWQERTCSGGPPGLGSAGLVFDTNRRRLVVVGGSLSGTTIVSSTWEVDPSTCTWIAQNPSTQPPGQTGAMLAWDSGRNVVVMFSAAADASTWEWDGAAGTWTQRESATVPPFRVNGGLAYDALRRRTVLFGGQTNFEASSSLNDTWEYNGDAGTWTQVMPPTSPAPRAVPSLFYDSERQRIVMFGGTDQNGGPSGLFGAELTDLWEWDGAQWSRRSVGASPAARSGAAGGWIDSSQLGVMFGGVLGDGERPFLNDTWLWKSGEWVQVSTVRGDTAPPAEVSAERQIEDIPAGRAGHSLATGNGTAMLFGGRSDTGVLNDAWTWDSSTYTWTALGPLSLAPRTGHAMVLLPNGNSFLFGGVGADDQLIEDLDDFYINFSQQITEPRPGPRTDLAMAVDVARNKVVLFGGRGASGALQDTWEYDIAKALWTRLAPATSPPARFGHSMFYDPNRQTEFILGGTGDDPSSIFNDVWEWNGVQGTWTFAPANVTFAARAGALAFFDSNQGRSVIYGGLTYSAGGSLVSTYGDTWTIARANEATTK